MANFSPLTAEICWRVLGHDSNFQRVSRLGFVTAATSLTGRQPNFARCSAVSWAATLYNYIYIYTLSGALSPWRKFARCKIHFTSKSCVLLYWQHYCTALQQQALAKLCGVVQGMELRNFRRGRHIYSAGRPSRWASAHISSYAIIFGSFCRYCSILSGSKTAVNRENCKPIPNSRRYLK